MRPKASSIQIQPQRRRRSALSSSSRDANSRWAGSDNSIEMVAAQAAQSAAIPKTNAASPSTSPTPDASGSPAGATLTGQTLAYHHCAGTQSTGASTSANTATVPTSAATSASGDSAVNSPDGPQSIPPQQGIGADGKPTAGRCSGLNDYEVRRRRTGSTRSPRTLKLDA